MLIVDLFPLKTCKFLQPHIQDGFGLLLTKFKISHKPVSGFFHGLACTDQGYDLVDMVQRYLEPLKYMGALFGLFQFELAAAGNDLHAVVYEILDELL